MKQEWFETWFDSPYYHTLYKNHDAAEASKAVDNLMGVIDLPRGSRVLDLACGKGRHSIHLADLGWDVTGLDISGASISYARQFEHEHLAFYQHDMRKPFRSNYFHAILNMFTSFGYFEHDRDHQQTIHHIANGLVSGGYFILDFFNAIIIREQMIPNDVKTINNIQFHLQKHIQDGHIFKTVAFETEGKSYTFTERVRLYEEADLVRLLSSAGLKVVQTFGDYDRSVFIEQQSKRLILIAQKS